MDEELRKAEAEKKRIEIEENFKVAQAQQEELRKKREDRLKEHGVLDGQHAQGPMGAFPSST